MSTITKRAAILVLAEVEGDGVATRERADHLVDAMGRKLGLKGVLTVVA